MLAKNQRPLRGFRLPALSFTTIVGTPPGACSLLQYTLCVHALRSDRRTQSQDNAPSFSAALSCGLSDMFACLAALA